MFDKYSSESLLVVLLLLEEQIQLEDKRNCLVFSIEVKFLLFKFDCIVLIPVMIIRVASLIRIGSEYII